MTNQIQSIPLDNLVPHPDNPNRMSKQNFAKLVRNIKRTGRYEPLIVRHCPENNGNFQIINGYHRWLALKELGEKSADTIVWDIDDQQADILLSTLNRLCGADVLEKKLALLARLRKNINTRELTKLLPQTKKQLEKLTQLDSLRVSSIEHRASSIANALVFFVSDKQMQIIEAALSAVRHLDDIASCPQKQKTKAQMRAEALRIICQYYLDHKQKAVKARNQIEQFFDEQFSR